MKEGNNTKNAVGYIRVSTTGQAGDDKYGIEAQRKEILLYANDHGYNIVKWYIDEISGTTEDRPEWNKIIRGEEVTNPPYQAVIVFKNDRVARDMKLYFYFEYTLEKRAIKLISAKEDFEGLGDLANIYRALLSFVAEQERKNIALRTGNGRKLKAACGGYSGGRPPYGYMVSNGQLKIVPEEADMIRILFKKMDAGETLQGTADCLTDEHGYHTRSGRRFTPTHIKQIYDNRKFYQGFYKYGKDMSWVRGVHEPIIPEDEQSGI